MPPVAKSTVAQRARSQLQLLKQVYPDAHCELHYSNPLELLIATILSAQCTDVRVNLVTPALFKRFPLASDYATASLSDLEELIRSTGFFRNKAKSIRECCRLLVAQYGGNVPATMEELIQLPGVGRKTANVVLGNAFYINTGIVVDTHVTRLSQRLGLTRHKHPLKIEQDLMTLIPQGDWCLVSHLLIWHGRRRCQARNPDCGNCELNAHCPGFEKYSK